MSSKTTPEVLIDECQGSTNPQLTASTRCGAEGLFLKAVQQKF